MPTTSSSAVDLFLIDATPWLDFILQSNKFRSCHCPYVISALDSFLQGYATACLALLQLGMYSSTERPDLALAHEQPWVRYCLLTSK